MFVSLSWYVPSLFLPSPLCFLSLPSPSSLKGGPGIPGVSAFPAGCRFGPLLPGLHGPKPGLRHALCSLHERGGCYRCGGDVPAAPSSRCFRHRDTGVPDAELLSHRCPFPFLFPFCPLSHCRQKAKAQTRHVHSGTRGGSQLCSSLLGHLFLFIVFKKGRKKKKKGFPITSSFSSWPKLPARTKFFQNLPPHFYRKVPPFPPLPPVSLWRGESGCGQERGYSTSRTRERMLEAEEE